jgi:hypothetical protein
LKHIAIKTAASEPVLFKGQAVRLKNIRGENQGEKNTQTYPPKRLAYFIVGVVINMYRDLVEFIAAG